MRGKNKCKILKEIRQQIADENDIPFVTQECSFQGECRGTCPKCEAELRYLEQQLEKRRRLGKQVTIAALAASLITSLTGCPEKANPETVGDVPYEVVESTTAYSDETPGAPLAPETTTDASCEIGTELTEESSELIGEVPDTTEEIFELEGDVAYTELQGMIAAEDPSGDE
ncbi:MAG: hypothetical protein E7434_01175 [Ruminococcaceae bacterium]|nr:hypothetical protein [Oscillospiraceae bacterium]